MITYTLLKSRPGIFEDLTGITPQQFEQIYANLEPVWAAAEQNRLGRRTRRRAAGAGRSYALPLKEQLLMSLMRHHLSLNTQAAGSFFAQVWP